MNKLLCFALFCISGLLWPHLAPAMHVNSAAGEREKLVRIGFSGPLSGASEEFGKSLANAAELAVIEANRQNLRIQGQRIQFKLLRMDDRNDVATAIAVARQLVSEGVVGVIGTPYSSTSQAVAGIYADAGIPMLTPSATAPILSRMGSGSSSFFRMVGRDDEIAGHVAEHAVRVMRLKRFAVIDNGSLFGAGVAGAFAAQALALGAQVVVHTGVDFTTDLRALVQQARRRGAQAVFFGGYQAHAAGLAQAIRQDGNGMRLLLASSGAVGPGYLAAARDAAEGTIAAESGLPNGSLPGWARFEEQFQRRFGHNLFSFSPFAYDAVQVLVAAMRKADADTPAQLVEALRKIRFQGLTGQIAFDEYGNQRHPVYTLFEVRQQRWVPVHMLGESRTGPQLMQPQLVPLPMPRSSSAAQRMVRVPTSVID